MLKDAEKRLPAMVKSAVGDAILIDANGTIAAGLRLSGYSADVAAALLAGGKNGR
jgi:hypothetical protein